MNNDSHAIVSEIAGSVAILRFNRPTKRNPLSLATLKELESQLSELIPRQDLDTIVFTGTDDVFASGADIRELADLDSASALKFSRFGQDLFQFIAEARQVTVAAINGFCMGGALDLALACDIRVGSPVAVFSHPGAKLGIITGWGGTQRLPRIMGRARALELFATAGRYSSQAALEMGLISRIADPVLECALEEARTANSVASPS
ncbi:MAG TPA: enoyl-CoA hydratase/isomerase family protein [Pyrinomonadaceae bacterium]|nr:enoyl-CoA hydratase/isomerase family protein [Pyrinomonadaceae bacterium]